MTWRSFHHFSLGFTEEEEWKTLNLFEGCEMDGVSSTNYMDALISISQKKQGFVLQNLLEVQAASVSIQSKPLKAISPSLNKVDLYA
jgi:hypothetical protein